MKKIRKIYKKNFEKIEGAILGTFLFIYSKIVSSISSNSKWYETISLGIALTFVMFIFYVKVRKVNVANKKHFENEKTYCAIKFYISSLISLMEILICSTSLITDNIFLFSLYSTVVTLISFLITIIISPYICDFLIGELIDENEKYIKKLRKRGILA